MASKRPGVDLIQVPAQVINMNPRADRSWKISFETRELSGDEVAMLAENFQAEGWLLFKTNEIDSSEVPESKADSGTKSQSQRQRDVIYILWKQRGGKGDFETFYRVISEQLIEYLKSKLESEEA